MAENERTAPPIFVRLAVDSDVIEARHDPDKEWNVLETSVAIKAAIRTKWMEVGTDKVLKVTPREVRSPEGRHLRWEYDMEVAQ